MNSELQLDKNVYFKLSGSTINSVPFNNREIKVCYIKDSSYLNQLLVNPNYRIVKDKVQVIHENPDDKMYYVLAYQKDVDGVWVDTQEFVPLPAPDNSTLSDGWNIETTVSIFNSTFVPLVQLKYVESTDTHFGIYELQPEEYSQVKFLVPNLKTSYFKIYSQFTQVKNQINLTNEKIEVISQQNIDHVFSNETQLIGNVKVENVGKPRISIVNEYDTDNNQIVVLNNTVYLDIYGEYYTLETDQSFYLTVQDGFVNRLFGLDDLDQFPQDSFSLGTQVSEGIMYLIQERDDGWYYYNPAVSDFVIMPQYDDGQGTVYEQGELDQQLYKVQYIEIENNTLKSMYKHQQFFTDKPYQNVQAIEVGNNQIELYTIYIPHNAPKKQVKTSIKIGVPDEGDIGQIILDGNVVIHGNVITDGTLTMDKLSDDVKQGLYELEFKPTNITSILLDNEILIPTQTIQVNLLKKTDNSVITQNINSIKVYDYLGTQINVGEEIDNGVILNSIDLQTEQVILDCTNQTGQISFYIEVSFLGVHTLKKLYSIDYTEQKSLVNKFVIYDKVTFTYDPVTHIYKNNTVYIYGRKRVGTDITYNKIYAMVGSTRIDETQDPITDEWRIAYTATNTTEIDVYDYDEEVLLDKLTFTRLDIGSGQYSIILTNQFEQIPADSEGNVLDTDYVQSTYVKVYNGNIDITQNCEFVIDDYGCAATGELDANGYKVEITEFQQNVNGYQIVKVIYNSEEIGSTQFNYQLIKQGVKGDTGDPSIVKYQVQDKYTFQYDPNTETYTGNTVYVTGKKVVGNEQPVDIPIKLRYVLNDVEYISTDFSTTQSVTVTESVQIDVLDETGVIDRLNFTKLVYGEDSYSIVLSNEYVNIPQDEFGNLEQFETETEVFVYRGTQQVSGATYEVTTNQCEHEINGNIIKFNNFTSIGYQDITVKVNGVEIGTKRFTFGISKQGTSGYYTDYVFKNQSTQPQTPTLPDPITEGWTDQPVNPNPGEYTWMSKSVKLHENLVEPWTTPVRITGEEAPDVLAQYSSDSTNWHDVYTETDKYIRFSYDGGQTWSYPAKFVGENGTDQVYRYVEQSRYTFVYDQDTGSYTDNSVTLTGYEIVGQQRNQLPIYAKIDDTTYNAGEQSNIVIIPNLTNTVTIYVYETNTTELVDIVTVHKLVNGGSQYSIVASNEQFVVPQSENGVVDPQTTQTSDITVYRGQQDITSLCTFTLSTQNCNATLSDVSDKKRVTITSFAPNQSGYQVVTVKLNDVTIGTKKIQYTLQKQGVHGNDQIFEYQVQDRTVFTYNPNTKTYSDNTITIRGYKVIGNQQPVYNEIYAKYVLNDITYTVTENINQEVIINTTESISIDIYNKSNKLIDTISFTKLIEGENQYNVVLSNGFVNVPQSWAGVPDTEFEQQTVVSVYKGSLPESNFTVEQTSQSCTQSVSGNVITFSNFVEQGTANIDVHIGDITQTVQFKFGLNKIPNKIEYRYQIGVTQPQLDKSNPNPQGWEVYLTSTPNDNEYLWMIYTEKDYKGNLVNQWCDPIRITGTNQVYKYAEQSSYVFTEHQDGSLTPSTITISSYKIVGQSQPVPLMTTVKYGSVTTVSDDVHVINIGTDITDTTIFEVYDGTELIDYITITKIKDGVDTYNVILTNEQASISQETDGSTNQTLNTQVLVYKGQTQLQYDQYSVTYTANGCTVTAGANKTYTITNFTADQGSVDFVITVSGLTFNKKFVYQKSKRGIQGQHQYSYWLESSQRILKFTNDDTTYSESSIKFDSKYKIGEGQINAFNGYFVIKYTSDNVTYTTLYSSTTAESTVTIQPNTLGKRISNIKCELYSNSAKTILLDQINIPVIEGNVYAILTNEYYQLPTNSSGLEYTIPTDPISKIEVYLNNVLQSGWTFAVSNQVGCTCEVDSNGNIKLKTISQDNGYADITASKSGYSITKRFSVVKNKQGIQGIPGTDQIYKYAIQSTYTFTYDPNTEIYTGNTVTITGYKVVGQTRSNLNIYAKIGTTEYGHTAPSNTVTIPGLQNTSVINIYDYSTNELIDTITVTKLIHGSSTYNIIVSNEHFSVPQYSDGKIADDQFEQVSDIYVYKGQTNITNQCTVIQTYNGCIATVSNLTDQNKKVVTINSFEDNISGYQDLLVKKTDDNTEIGNKRIQYTLSKQGIKGDQGEHQYQYWLESSQSALKVVNDKVYSESSITLNAKYKIGEGQISNYNGYFVVEYTNDSVYTTLYSSTTAESSKTVSLPSEYIKNIRCKLYQDSNKTILLDQINIPVIEGSLYAILTNEFHQIPTDSNGENQVIPSTPISKMEVYLNNNLQTGWTFAISNSVGCTCTVNSNGEITLTSISQDNGYVDIVASKAGYTSLTKRFSVSKNKQGVQGIQGEPQVRKYIVLDQNTFVYDPNIQRFIDGSESKTVIQRQYQKIGSQAEQPISVYWQVNNEPSVQQSSIEIVVNGIEEKTVKAFQDSSLTVLIDQQTINVINTQENQYDIVINNEFEQIPADQYGVVLDPAYQQVSYVNVYSGSIDITRYCTFEIEPSDCQAIGQLDNLGYKLTVSNFQSDKGYQKVTAYYDRANMYANLLPDEYIEYWTDSLVGTIRGTTPEGFGDDGVPGTLRIADEIGSVKFNYQLAKQGNQSTIYYIVADKYVVTYDPNENTFDGEQSTIVNLTAYKQVGNEQPVESSIYWAVNSVLDTVQSITKQVTIDNYMNYDVTIYPDSSGTSSPLDTVTINVLSSQSETYTILLDNEQAALPQDSDGNILDYSIQTHTPYLYRGSSLKTDNLTVVIQNGTFKVNGQTLSTNSTVQPGSTVILTEIQQGYDSQSITYKYTYNGNTISKTFKQTKVKYGKDQVDYFIVADKHTVVYDPNNLKFDGQDSVSIQVKQYKRIANGQHIAQPVYWKIDDGQISSTSSISTNVTVNQNRNYIVNAYINKTDTDPFDTVTISVLNSQSETYVLLLDNEQATLQQDQNGNVSSYTLQNHSPKLYRGSTLITGNKIKVQQLSGATFKVGTTTLAVGTVIQTDQLVEMSNMTQDNQSITYQYVDNANITKKFVQSKSKQGIKGDQGVQGDPQVTYYIVPDKHTVVYDPNNLTFDGQSSVSIQIKQYKRVGNNQSVLQNVYWKMNDTNYNDPWTQSNSINIVVNQAFYNQYGNSINIKAYLNSTDTDPIDIQTINILDSQSETYILLLDNEQAVLQQDQAGTVSNYTTQNHKPSLYRGAELITNSTLEITQLSGGTFKVNTTTLSVGSTVQSSGQTITLSNMTQDNQYITYKHNPSGITKTFKQSKSKQGIQGEQGEPQVRKYIVLDQNMFVYNPNTERFSDGTSSKTVTQKQYQKVGNQAEQLIPVYWKIGSGAIDTTQTTTKNIPINSVVGNTTVLAYQDSQGTILIDQQTISVISSQDDQYNIVMTNEFDTVQFDQDNNLIDPRTSITTNVYQYKGTTQKTLSIVEQSGGTFTLSDNTLSLDANSIQADTQYCIVKIVEFPSVTKRFTVKKVKNGKEAQYIEFRYKNAQSKPSQPTIFNPTDWSLTPTQPQAGQFTWVTQQTKYKDSLVNSWSEPVKYTYPSLQISVTNITGRQTVYNGSTFTPANVTFTPKLMQDDVQFNTGTFYIYNQNGTQLATVTSGSQVNIQHSQIFSTDDRYNIYNEKSLLLKITFNGVEYISNLIVEMKNTQYNWLSQWNNTTVIGNENIATGKLFVGQNVSGNLSGVYIGNTKDIGGTVYDPGIVQLKDNTERFKVNVDSNKDVNVHIGDSSNYLNYSTSNSTLEIKGKLRLVSGQTPSFPLPEGQIAYWTDTLIDDIGGVTPEGYGRPLLDPILEVDGDAIINGTLTADKVDTNNFFTKNFVVKTGGTIASEGHESFSSTTPGFWLGKDTSDNKYKFFVGDINNQKYLQFNGNSTYQAGDLFGQFVGDAYLYNTEFIKDTDNETGEIVYDQQLQQIYRFPTTGLELLKTFGTSTQYIQSLQNIQIQPQNKYQPQTGTSGVSQFTVKTTESQEITTSAANTPYYRIEVRVYKYFPQNYFKGQSAGEKYYQTLIFDFTDVILYGQYTQSTNKLQISFSKSNRSVTVQLLNESNATIKTITKKQKSDITKIDYRTFQQIKKTANTVVNGMSYTFTTRDSGHQLVQIQADPDQEGEILNQFDKSTVVNSVYGIVKQRTFDGVATQVYLADVQEKIWCDEELEQGIPIQIRKGKLVKAVNPFKKVWITSTNPGVILGSKRENQVQIALTGSTYVNCIQELDDEICLSVNGKLKVATLFDKLIGKYIIGKVIQKEDNKSLILLY